MFCSKYSKSFSLISFAIILCGLCCCHSKQQIAPLPYQVKEQINNDFLIIRDSELNSYLNSLIKKLILNYADQVSIYIAQSPGPFARSFPGGQVLVSTSLIQTCNSESELAFVLAHELGHVILGHHSQSVVSLSIEELRERELAADDFGANAIMRAGYSFSAAISSIQRLTSIWDFYGSQGQPGYPSTADRLSRLQHQFLQTPCIITGRCLLNGVENTREFVKFRLKLNSIIQK